MLSWGRCSSYRPQIPGSDPRRNLEREPWCGGQRDCALRLAPTRPPREDAGKEASCPLVVKGRSTEPFKPNPALPAPAPPNFSSGLLQTQGFQSFRWQRASYQSFCMDSAISQSLDLQYKIQIGPAGARHWLPVLVFPTPSQF